MLNNEVSIVEAIFNGLLLYQNYLLAQTSSLSLFDDKNAICLLEKSSKNKLGDHNKTQ